MLILSDHAKIRIAQRGLDPAWVEATAAADWTGLDSDPSLTHAFKAIAAVGGRIQQFSF